MWLLCQPHESHRGKHEKADSKRNVGEPNPRAASIDPLLSRRACLRQRLTESHLLAHSEGFVDVHHDDVDRRSERQNRDRSTCSSVIVEYNLFPSRVPLPRHKARDGSSPARWAHGTKGGSGGARPSSDDPTRLVRESALATSISLDRFFTGTVFDLVSCLRLALLTLTLPRRRLRSFPLDPNLKRTTFMTPD